MLSKKLKTTQRDSISTRFDPWFDDVDYLEEKIVNPWVPRFPHAVGVNLEALYVTAGGTVAPNDYQNILSTLPVSTNHDFRFFFLYP